MLVDHAISAPEPCGPPAIELRKEFVVRRFIFRETILIVPALPNGPNSATADLTISIFSMCTTSSSSGSFPPVAGIPSIKIWVCPGMPIKPNFPLEETVTAGWRFSRSAAVLTPLSSMLLRPIIIFPAIESLRASTSDFDPKISTCFGVLSAVSNFSEVNVLVLANTDQEVETKMTDNFILSAKKLRFLKKTPGYMTRRTSYPDCR